MDFFLFLFLPLTVCPLPAPREWCGLMIRLKTRFFPSCSKLSLRGSPSEPPPVDKNGGVIFYKSHGFLLGERRGCPCGIHRAMEQCPGSTPFLPSLDADDVPLVIFLLLPPLFSFPRCVAWRVADSIKRLTCQTRQDVVCCRVTCKAYHD